MNNMIESIKELCIKIAKDHKLEGNDTIEIYSNFISNDIKSEEELDAMSTFSGHNEFSGIEIKEYVEAFSLLMGSIGTFLSLRKSSKGKKEKITTLLLKNSWKNRLIAEGLESEKAELIVSSFTDDLKLIFFENE